MSGTRPSSSTTVARWERVALPATPLERSTTTRARHGQNVRAFNYGNLTFSNFTKVLEPTGTIGISGVFTPGTAIGHTITGSTVNFNGTGAQTVPAFNFNNLTISGARGANNVTLVNGGTIGVAGIFNPIATFAGGNYVITNNTVDFNGSGSQTIPAFNYFNLTSSNVGARTLANSGIIGIASVFTPGTNVYTIAGSTVIVQRHQSADAASDVHDLLQPDVKQRGRSNRFRRSDRAGIAARAGGNVHQQQHLQQRADR